MNRIDALAAEIARLARGLPDVRLMEVCGTHTEAIKRYALDTLLPKNVRLVSGPGCPVCVTSAADVGLALSAAKGGARVVCFGDMLRVPANGESLYRLRGAGCDVTIVSSALEALPAAKREPERQVVYFAVGFETTAPSTAALVLAAKNEGIGNLSVLSAHKTMPNAIRALLYGGSRIDALICPGHVAAMTGADAFRFVADELGLPAAIAGFTPEDVLCAVLSLLRMLRAHKAEVVNLYARAVRPEPNAKARELLMRVFTPCDARWRGLGTIANSGLALNAEFAAFDAAKRLFLVSGPERDEPGCLCGAILRGEAEPADCGLFSSRCTPDDPAGPCMVSREGACAAQYRYGGRVWSA